MIYNREQDEALCLDWMKQLLSDLQTSMSQCKQWGIVPIEEIQRQNEEAQQYLREALTKEVKMLSLRNWIIIKRDQ